MMERRTGGVEDTATLAVGTELHRSCCDARASGRVVRACTTWLGRHADYVNSIGVYPVPDGDTGRNLYLTMQAALREPEVLEDQCLSGVRHAVSRGASMGARGNSGRSGLLTSFDCATRPSRSKSSTGASRTTVTCCP